MIKSKPMNSYELSRKFWNYSFDNPEKIKPIHSAIYFFAIEHCNRLGWKEKFGFPSQMVMEAIGVKNWRTYSKGLNELVDFGFIKMIERSKNQYSSNIIAIVKNAKAQSKALDKALQKHNTKQCQSTVSIDKQLNNEQLNKEQHSFNSEIETTYSYCVELFPKKTQPKTLTEIRKWKDEIRKLIEIDKLSPEQIKHIVNCARDDEFWSKNFLSIMKLRKKDKNEVNYFNVFLNNFGDLSKSNGVWKMR